MLEKMTLSLARAYYDENGAEYDEDDIEVYSYRLQMFLAPLFDVLFVLTAGLIIGRFFETIAFLAAFIVLRSSAGGYHAKTFFRCFLGLLVIYGLHLVILYLTPVTLVYQLSIAIIAISIFPILKYAPIADANKPIGPIQSELYRKRSVVILLVQSTLIVGVSIFGIATSHTGIVVAEIFPYILLSFAIGQLTASGTLVAAIIHIGIRRDSKYLTTVK